MGNPLVEQAIAAFHQGESDMSEHLLRQAIADYADDPEPRSHLANLLSAQNRHQEALQWLQPVAHRPELCFQAVWLRFVVAWQTQDRGALQGLLHQLLHSDQLGLTHLPSMLDAARQAGLTHIALRCAERLDMPSEASSLRWAQRFSRVLRLSPRALWRAALHRWNRRLQRRGRWRASRILLEAAYNADPQNAQWPRALAWRQRQTRDVYDPHWQSELTWHETALRLDPGHLRSHYGRCLTLFDMGRWREVLEALDQIPKHDWAIAMRAACLANLNQSEAAVKLYQEHETQLGNPARLSLGVIFYNQNNLTEAHQVFSRIDAQDGLAALKKFFQTVIQNPPDHSEPYFDAQLHLNALPLPEAFDAANALAHEPVLSGCPLCCANVNAEPLWRDRQSGWLRVRCPNCAMIYVAPTPGEDEIRRLYQDRDHHQHTLQRRYKAETEALQHLAPAACRQLPLYGALTNWQPDFDWLAWEAGLGPEKRYLDVGCSAGRAVLLMQNCDWCAQGIDLDGNAIHYGRQLGMELSEAALERLDTTPRYHLISLLDVIEHVPYPLETLRQCYQRLRAGGLLVVKTPGADSLPHYLVGNAWLESEEHLMFFSRDTLQKALESAGFEILSIRQTMEAPTPFLHYKKWQGRFYPQGLYQTIHQLRVGDTLALLGRKPND